MALQHLQHLASLNIPQVDTPILAAGEYFLVVSEINQVSNRLVVVFRVFELAHSRWGCGKMEYGNAVLGGSKSADEFADRAGGRGVLLGFSILRGDDGVDYRLHLEVSFHFVACLFYERVLNKGLYWLVQCQSSVEIL